MVRSYVVLRVDGCSYSWPPAVAQFNITFNNVNMTALEILNIPASPVATAVRPFLLFPQNINIHHDHTVRREPHRDHQPLHRVQRRPDLPLRRTRRHLLPQHRDVHVQTTLSARMRNPPVRLRGATSLLAVRLSFPPLSFLLS